MEVQKRIKQIAADKQKHKRMLTMSSKNFTFEVNHRSKEKSPFLTIVAVVTRTYRRCQHIKFDLMMAFLFNVANNVNI